MTGIADYLPCMPFTEKFLRVPGDIEVTGRHVKRYHVNTIDDEIPGAIQEAAYAFLPRLLPEPDGETPPAGWVVLHKRAGTAAYLCSYSWVGRGHDGPPRPFGGSGRGPRWATQATQATQATPGATMGHRGRSRMAVKVYCQPDISRAVHDPLRRSLFSCPR